MTTRQELAAGALADHRSGEPRSPRDHELLALLLERLPVMITTYDPRLRAFRLNAAYRRVLGWTEEDAAEKGLLALAYPDPALRAEVVEFMTSLAPGWREFRATAKDGSVVPCAWSNLRLSDDTQVGIGLDLRERMAAEQALRTQEQEARARATELEAVLNSISDGVLVYDREGRTIRSNPAADEILRVPAAERARPVQERVMSQYEVWSEDGRRLGRDDMVAVRAALHGERVERAIYRVQSRGHEGRWLMISGTPLLVGGEHAGAVVSLTDVTEQKIAEDALRRHEVVVQQSRDVILFIRRADGRLLEANAAAIAAYGYGREELLALTVHELRAEEARALAAVEMAEADAAGVLFETVHRRKDGSTFPVEVSSRGVTVGGVRMLVSIVRDITERRRAAAREHAAREQAEQRAAELDAILDSLAQPLAVTDARGNLVRANPAFRRLLEATGADARRGTLSEPAGSPGARALAGETVHGLVQEVARPDGSALHLATSSAPIRTADGAVVGAVVVFNDVTERIRTEQGLRDADRHKGEFLAMLSHELRNPLAPIRNSVYLLDRAPAGSEQATRAKEVIRRQAEHLTRLVDDLLDITRISRGKITLQRARVDLREIVRKTTDDLASVFAQAGVALHVDHVLGPVWVDADPTRVAQVLGNLLQNAVKFTPSGGAVTVGLAASGARAALRVRDDGVGMEPGSVERMFEPFAQAEQTLARSNGGLGLGLALVKGLVELHGGTVEARSEGAGRGAEFVVRLPLAEGAAAGPGERGAEGAARPRVILVVEDNLDAGQSLADILELDGHRVRVARDGLTGIALARELRPDVVLCDIGLPDVDGYAVARALRADPALAATRLVALSGYAQPEDRQRSREAGFDAHVAKPPDIAVLVAALGGA